MVPIAAKLRGMIDICDNTIADSVPRAALIHARQELLRCMSTMMDDGDVHVEQDGKDFSP